MDMKKAFEQGLYGEIADNPEGVSSSEDRLMLGIALFKLGRKKQAMQVFNEIASEINTLAKVFYYMGSISRDLRDTEQAGIYLERYLQFYPDDDEAYDLMNEPEHDEGFVDVPTIPLARIYAQQGHYEQALGIYSRLLKETDTDAETRKEAHDVQDRYIIHTLETWLERLKK